MSGESRGSSRREAGWRREVRSLGTLLVCLSLGGCGYHFVSPSQTPLATRYARVAIPMVENRTPEPALASVCTQLLSRRFEPSHKIVPSAAEADLSVEGVIVEERERVIGLGPASSRGLVEVEVVLVFELFATARDTERVGVRGVEGRAVYLRDGAPVAIDARRRAALEEACGEAVADATLQLFTELKRVGQAPRSEADGKETR